MKCPWCITGIVLITQVLGSQQESEADWTQLMRRGRTALETRQYIDAAKAYSAAVENCERNGTADARLALSLGQLGIAMVVQGQHSQGTKFLRRSAAIFEGLAETHPRELATVWQVLGVSLSAQRLYSQAEHAYLQALNLRSTGEREDEIEVVHLLSNLGSAYLGQRRFPEARLTLERARKLLEKADPDQFFRGNLLNNIGALYRVEGRHAEAERVYEEALAGLNPVQDPDGVLTTKLLNNLAVEYMGRKEYRLAAAAFLRAAVRIEQGTVLPRADVAQILDHYRRCLRKVGEPEEVRRLELRSKLILDRMPTSAEGLMIDVQDLRRSKGLWKEGK